jgi:hypothetical protein
MTPAQKKRLHEIPALLKHLANEAVEESQPIDGAWRGGLAAPARKCLC